MLLAGRPDDVLGIFANGVGYGHVYAEISGGTPGAEGVRNFASIESQVLLHQVCETLIRLYFAHAGHPPCPWLEVAGERFFDRFKKRVRESLLDRPAASLHDDVAYVFLGGTASDTGLDEDQWRLAVGNLTTFLRVFARRWLDDSPAYNSLKHGLAVVPSAADLWFATELGSPDARKLGGGPSLAYLESELVAPKRRKWRMTTRWIDISESLALTQVARQMIDSLWGRAQVRYTDREESPRRFFPVDLTPDKLRTPDRLPGQKWTFDIGIEEAR